mgnify:CR=1 FL=1
MKELIKIANEENFITERGTILSTNLVTIINEFRKVESEANEEKRFIELKHKSLMEKIRKEDETLKTLGLNGGQNFLPTSYKDIQGKTQPCYELNRDGMIIILNSESAIVRYYTMEYIKKLEEKLKQVTKEVKHYEKKKTFNDESPLLMEGKKSDTIYNNFKNNTVRKELERVINKTGIKVTNIAKAINISDSNMSDFRNNKINFNDDKLELIIKILDSAKGLLLLL